MKSVTATATRTMTTEPNKAETVEGDPSGPPKQYYAAQEAICSECGRHVDLCHKHGKREDIWEVKHEDSSSG